uniref:Uncharacterized protein n=1 Tax=Arundo donax TaxID=35708 RepID=A0A0A9EMN0_ARUDO
MEDLVKLLHLLASRSTRQSGAICCSLDPTGGGELRATTSDGRRICLRRARASGEPSSVRGCNAYTAMSMCTSAMSGCDGSRRVLWRSEAVAAALRHEAEEERRSREDSGHRR